MPQQNQFSQYSNMPSFYGNNTMNMPNMPNPNSMQQGILFFYSSKKFRSAKYEPSKFQLSRVFNAKYDA